MDTTSTFYMKLRRVIDGELTNQYINHLYTVEVSDSNICFSSSNFPDYDIREELEEFLNLETEQQVYITCIFYLSSRNYTTDIQVMVTGKTNKSSETKKDGLLREVKEEIGSQITNKNIVDVSDKWQELHPYNDIEGRRRVAGYVLLNEGEFINIDSVQQEEKGEKKDIIMAIGLISIGDLLKIVTRGSTRLNSPMDPSCGLRFTKSIRNSIGIGIDNPYFMPPLPLFNIGTSDSVRSRSGSVRGRSGSVRGRSGSVRGRGIGNKRKGEINEKSDRKRIRRSSPSRRLKKRVVKSPKKRVIKSPKKRVIKSPKKRVVKSPKKRVVKSPKKRVVKSPKKRVVKN